MPMTWSSFDAKSDIEYKFDSWLKERFPGIVFLPVEIETMKAAWMDGIQWRDHFHRVVDGIWHAEGR